MGKKLSEIELKMVIRKYVLTEVKFKTDDIGRSTVKDPGMHAFEIVKALKIKGWVGDRVYDSLKQYLIKLYTYDVTKAIDDTMRFIYDEWKHYSQELEKLSQSA